MLSDQFYFLQSTSVRCDVIVLLPINVVIQSPQIRTGGILAHAQAVEKSGLDSRLLVDGKFSRPYLGLVRDYFIGLQPERGVVSSPTKHR